MAISFRTASVRVFSLTVREDAGHVVPGEEDIRQRHGREKKFEVTRVRLNYDPCTSIRQYLEPVDTLTYSISQERLFLLSRERVFVRG